MIAYSVHTHIRARVRAYIYAHTHTHTYVYTWARARTRTYTYRQGHLYVIVRPRPANKLCPLNFSISTCINFLFFFLVVVNIINVELRYFIFQSVIKNVLQNICFLQILRPLRLWRPKVMALLT